MRGERRGHFRLAVSVAPEAMRIFDARGPALAPLVAEITEVSGGGVRLRVPADGPHPQAGQRLALRFALADEALELKGRVVWVDAETADGTLVAGVSFEDVDAIQRRRIVAAMNEHRRRYGAPESRPSTGSLR